MRIIAHRGRLESCPDEGCNTVNRIFKTLNKNFDIELDVWAYDEKEGLFLGHDEPCEKLSTELIVDYSHHMWLHAKNKGAIEALFRLNYHFPGINFFYHENDSYVLTSQGYIWIYPEVSVPKCNNNARDFEPTSVVVLPEKQNIDLNDAVLHNDVLAICTDYPEYYRKIL